MMAEVIYQDEIGEGLRLPGPSFNDIGLSHAAKLAFTAVYGQDFQLSPPQAWAIENDLLEGTAHFLICAATNSGKTLIAYLRMLHRLAEPGRRFVYVVPLKALAEEKATELEQLCDRMVAYGGPHARVAKSTGDYQLTADFLGSAPPTSGEIVVCTPERLEVIARNPENADWLRAIDTFVLDEFHLLGDRQRGAAMECLTTRALTLCPEASILALSATIGNPDDLAGWLAHTGSEVKTLASNFRYPVLKRSIVQVDGKDDYLAGRVQAALAQPDASVLIFVYRKNDAERLAQTLAHATGESAIEYFHAGISMAQRAGIASRFRGGEVRVLVTTTSLKMGVNTPATYVFVRDTVFAGNGQLTPADVEQMLGRAGRGDVPGQGVVICSPKEESGSYREAFTTGETTAIAPQLMPITEDHWGHKRKNQVEVKTDQVASAVLSEVARHEFITTEKIAEFFSHTLSGWAQTVASVDYTQRLSQMERDKLVYKVENSESTFAPTKLGRTTAWCGLSAESGAMLAGFLRALIRLSDKEQDKSGKQHDYLRRLTNLDLLFVAVASFEGRRYVPRTISKDRRSAVEAKIETLEPEDKPLLNLWRSSHSVAYPTRRLLSSLRLPKEIIEKDAEDLFYRLMMTAMILYEYANGKKLDVLAEEYGMRVGDLEAGLKFTTTWLLNCLAQICSPGRCYHLHFLAMRCFELMENLSFGSTLGKLLSVKGVGRKTVQELVNNDISDFRQLVTLSEEAMTGFGVPIAQCKKILQYARRSTR